MAEIEIERRANRTWLWVLLALLALALVWWFAVQRHDEPSVVGTNAVAPTVASTGEAVPNGMTDAGVERFLAHVEQGPMTGDADLSHEYVAEGVRRLATAVSDLAVRDTLGGTALGRQTAALNTLAAQLQDEPRSTAHGDLARAALLSGADLLGEIQRGRFPAAADDVAAARRAAESVLRERPMLEQRQAVREFFTRAANAVRAMRTNP